jgi:hypothetical protein
VAVELFTVISIPSVLKLVSVQQSVGGGRMRRRVSIEPIPTDSANELRK